MQPKKPVWDKKRPKSLGESKPLSSKAQVVGQSYGKERGSSVPEPC
jgi:hypothetical protein